MSFLLSCNNNDNKKKAVFYGSDYTSEFQTESSSTKPRLVGDYLDISDETIAVPFLEKSGVKYVEVSVNGFNFEMIFSKESSNFFQSPS